MNASDNREWVVATVYTNTRVNRTIRRVYGPFTRNEAQTLKRRYMREWEEDGGGRHGHQLECRVHRLIQPDPLPLTTRHSP